MNLTPTEVVAACITIDICAAMTTDPEEERRESELRKIDARIKRLRANQLKAASLTDRVEIGREIRQAEAARREMRLALFSPAE